MRHNQAYLALHQNNPVQAAAFVMESLAFSCDANNEIQIAFGLATLGNIAVVQRQPQRGARLLGAAEAWFDSTSYGPPQWVEHEPYVVDVRAQLGEEAFAAAWMAGRAMTLERALAYALAGSDADSVASVRVARSTQ